MDFVERYKLLLESNGDRDAALMHLREIGATPIEAIKTLMISESISLGEAKKIFCSSIAWREVAETACEFHDEIEQLLKDNQLEKD